MEDAWIIPMLRFQSLENAMNTHTFAGGPLRLKPLAACLIVPLAVSNLACSAAMAATLPVTNCNDSGIGSLRDTVAGAQSGDTIDLRSLSCERIPATTGELVIAANDVELLGPGSTKLTIPGVNHTGVGTLYLASLRVADGMCGIASNGIVSLNESIVTACPREGVKSKGGLILRNSTISNNGYTGVRVYAGNISISGSTISGNAGSYCGALETDGQGTVRIENTTISGNRGSWSACVSASSVAIVNSTFAFATAPPSNIMTGYSAVGLTTNALQVQLESTIFANNATGDLQFPASTVISGHNNLLMRGATFWETGAKVPLPADTLSADPMLQPLADNGGPTMTHALHAGSPAIDTGNNVSAFSADQRGFPFLRTSGARADIGAYETQPTPLNSFAIGPGITGSWFDPLQSGHGLMLEVLPGNRLLAFWFTFNPEGTQQVWFGGVGTYSNNTAIISDVALPTGGRWLPNFDSTKVVSNPWGSITFTFTDCNHGKVDFNSVRGFGSGSMDLTRLTLPAGLSCP